MIRSVLVPAAAALLALAVLSQPTAAQPPGGGADPLIREGQTRKVSDHVWVIPDNSVPMVPNVGIIIGSKATLVIDTGMGARNGETVMREVAKVSRNAEIYLVATHFHPEHDLGAGGFPASVKMIRSQEQVKDIEEFGLTQRDQFAARSPLNAELLKGATFRKADILFDQERMLDLGGVQVRFIAMGSANHTRGDTAIMVQPDAVLFSGDDAMSGAPAFASPYSNLAHWLASLDRLDALKPKVVVPSHGPVGDAGFIAGYRSLFITVRDRATALKREGKTVDETVATVSGELTPRWDRGRVGGAIRAAYAEAR